MGNDFTVEARTSVYDTEKGMYVPFDISSAEDVAISIVGLYRRITGGDVKVTPSGVSASFPGTVPVGRYGVEILFRDSEGKGRVFERNLFEVVGSSGEATLESSAEGETGDGLNITVDVRTRTVRIGGTGAADYPSLTGKPSINGVVLEGDKTPEELGIAPSHIIPSETAELLMSIASSLKQAGEIEIPEESFRKLEALPEVAFVSLYGGNTALLGAGPIVKGKVDTFTVITGLSCLSPDKCSDFAYTAVDGKYIAGRFVGSVPKSISLDANADGTMTSSLPLEQALGTSGGYSFPAFIVRLKNNSRYYRYYPARDIQVVTQEYGDIPTRAYLSINGVYYKWEEDILTPIMSTIGKTPVIYDLRLEAPGGNLTIDDNGFGNSIIIDEIDFKARNPDKSTLIVRVSTYDKRSILFTSFKQGSDGVITSVSLYGYDPEDGRVNGAVLSITPDKTISLKEELAYIPSGETYTKVEADGRFETKEQAVADLEKKADKTAIKPYDISWIYNYISGKEDIPEDKYNEIKKVIDDNRFFILKEGVVSTPLFGNYNPNGILLWGALSPAQPAFITMSILNYHAADHVLRHKVYNIEVFQLWEEPSMLNNDSTVTYSGENEAIYVAKSGEKITNLKVTCTSPGDPVNPMMDYPKTREAKLIFECGPNADITFENVQWNDWDAPDFKTASHCICEISIMYVYLLKKFIGKYMIYPPTHLTQPSWSLQDYTTFGATDSPSIQVTDNDNVGWKMEYPDWMEAEGGIDSGTGSGTVSFQCTNDGAEQDGYMTLKSADGRKVFVKCYVRQEGV